jgi:hypothetical protein
MYFEYTLEADGHILTAAPYTDVTISYLSASISGAYQNSTLYTASAVAFDATNSKANPYPY